jgi:hypothetical protein
MANEATGEKSAEDREAIRLAKARLARVCRLTGLAAEQTLTLAAADQRAALVAVAMLVLAASPQDLAAGRVVEVGRAGGGGWPGDAAPAWDGDESPTLTSDRRKGPGNFIERSTLERSVRWRE